MTVEKKLQNTTVKIVNSLVNDYAHSKRTLRAVTTELFRMAMSNDWDDDAVSMNNCMVDIMSQYEQFKNLARFGYPMTEKRPNYTLYLAALLAALSI